MNAPTAAPAMFSRHTTSQSEETPLLRALRVLPVGVLAVDDTGHVVWANARAAALCSRPASELPGCRREEILQALMSSGEQVSYQASAVSDGPEGWAEVGALVEGPRRTTAAASELSAVFGEGRIDPVTGLLSRKAMLAELAAQVSRSRRYGNPLSIIRMHVDFPDDCDLKRSRKVVAQALKGCLRWVDYVGAWSEKAYLLILPETRLAPSRKLAVKVTAEASRQLAAEACPVAPVVCSVAEWQRGEDAATLLERATEPTQDTGATEA